MGPARSRLGAALPILLAFLAVLAGWLWWRQSPPPPPKPGPLRLTPTQFSALPGWAGADPAGALAAFRRSCALLAKRPPAAALGGAGYAGTAGDWQPACAALPHRPANAQTVRRYFETWFRPFAIAAGEAREGLFTGYYEPQIRASRSRHGEYQTPVYGVPDDLITVDLGKFRAKWAHESIAGRVVGHSLEPYPDRAGIDANGLKTAPILFYAADPIAVFFLHIQGSGRVVFDDGSMARVAYAAQNGQPYTAIGRTLIAEGAIPRENVSLQSIRAWLQAHPDQARRVMETNRSYVFFQEKALADPALGAAGSQGVPLTPGASLAVDRRLHPLGAPFFVAATAPGSRSGQAGPGLRPAFDRPGYGRGHSRAGARRCLLGLRPGCAGDCRAHEGARPLVRAAAQAGGGASG